MPESTPTDRLAEGGQLARTIRGAAHNVAFRNGADPDDVEQDMCLAILERFAEEPEFLDQKNAYIVNYGAWKASDALKLERRHNGRNTATYTEERDEDRNSALSSNPWMAVDERLTAGADVTTLVRQVLAELDPTDRAIAEALMQGRKPSRIGPDVGCCKRSVYNKMVVIRGELERAGVTRAALAA